MITASSGPAEVRLVASTLAPVRCKTPVTIEQGETFQYR